MVRSGSSSSVGSCKVNCDGTSSAIDAVDLNYEVAGSLNRVRGLTGNCSLPLESSLTIMAVPVPWPGAIVPLLRTCKVTVNFSSGSIWKSPNTRTVMFPMFVLPE